MCMCVFFIQVRRCSIAVALFAVAFDIGFELVDVGAHQAVNFLAVFEEDERGHGFDVELLRDGFALIDVALEEDHGVLVVTRAPVFDLRRDAQARAAPARRTRKSTHVGALAVRQRSTLTWRRSPARSACPCSCCCRIPRAAPRWL